MDRNSLLSEANALLQKSVFSKEDASKVENLIRLADSLTDRSELRRATMATHTRELASIEKQRLQAEDAELRSYLMGGREAVEGSRALSGATGSGGGYVIPDDVSQTFENLLAAYDELFAVATLYERSGGGDLAYPILDDTANSAAIVAENTASSSNADFVFQSLGFGSAPMWRTGVVRASVELANDSAVNLSDLVAAAFAIRIARGVGASFVSTLLSSAALGKTAASATAIAADEVLDLVDSVDSDYSARGAFLMRRATLTHIQKIKSSGGGAFMFTPQLDSNGRQLLCGFPVYLSPSMPAIATGAKSVCFGDLSRFIRRQVAGSFQVRTYVERYAELGQIAWEGFLRCNGGLAKSGNVSPVKFLQQA